MAGFLQLLRTNRNYRHAWLGQVVSEIGDHFNNIAVFSLAMHVTGSALVVSGILVSRGVAAIIAGPIAGVVLDRADRRRVMMASDLLRFLVALLFIVIVRHPVPWLMYTLSFALMFASPFFTSGRSALLPSIASENELHTANALAQTTQSATLTVGTMAAGISAATLGYETAFVLNSLSFLFSAFAIYAIRLPRGESRARVRAHNEADVLRPWHEYVQGLRYMRREPLVLGIALLGVGWASGGGAAQVLFTVFGELVFARGPAGIGIVWGCAGLGLIAGGLLAHRIGRGLAFGSYKRLIAACYVVHGGTYMLFSQMESFGLALGFIALSRAAVAISSVLNTTLLLRHVPNEYRGRVFSTMDSLIWGTMLLSMVAAGLALQTMSPRTVGLLAGACSSLTAGYWFWADRRGWLQPPAPLGVQPEEVEVRRMTRA